MQVDQFSGQSLSNALYYNERMSSMHFNQVIRHDVWAFGTMVDFWHCTKETRGKTSHH